jgi:prophage maintenance system killer protein
VTTKNKTLSTRVLTRLFSKAWLIIDAHDKEDYPSKGPTKKKVGFSTEELSRAFQEFKKILIAKKQAGELSGVERQKNSLAGIVGNVSQSFGGKELYGTAEEKAAHLFYFIVKNHPFADGNKRNGAFAFVWFLNKAGILNTARLSPEALAALTLLVAGSNPKDKELMIGLILLFLKK